MDNLLRNKWFLGLVALVAIIAFLFGDELVALANKPKSGTVLDEAKEVGRSEDTLTGADEDYFIDMDDGITKDPEALADSLQPFLPGITPEKALESTVIGRNNWIVWSAGNDAFWDELTRRSFGTVDLLKIISNDPGMSYSRDNRWEYFGLVNEPCFEKGDGPREDRHGLWLDKHADGCGPDPFESEENYPGVAIGERGKNVELGSYYGYGTGIVGLRLFPNPDFDEAAEQAWDAEKYYKDKPMSEEEIERKTAAGEVIPKPYVTADLVRPYRVGMSCGFCHVGPNPSNPPADPENPEWENLSSLPGAQYFWVDRILLWEDANDPDNKDNFVYQMLHTSRPGTLDTSLISSDNINNPRTMNAVYGMGPRMLNAKNFGKATIADGGLNNAQLNDYVPDPILPGPLETFYEAPDTVYTPRVLKDGSDSVGALGALNRVYVNIGLFSEEWLLHFIPMVGGPKVTPFEIEVARENSNYWRATEAQTPDVGIFFLAATDADKLEETPGGSQYLTADEEELEMGKEAYASYCARCHSSKLPDGAEDFFGDDFGGPDYLDNWKDYWEWTQTQDFRDEIVDIVMDKDFLKGNYLSNELRVPVTLLEINACSTLATNALEGNIWNDFSSRSYKDLPSVGTITVHDPLTGDPTPFKMPAGGRGYIRPASLTSLWTSAPYLLNNTVGNDPSEYSSSSGSVDDRMARYEDGMEKMLWPENRDGDGEYMTASGTTLPGLVDRTDGPTYLKVSHGYLPSGLRRYLSFRSRFLGFLPWVDPSDNMLKIGPFPDRTPINLLANISLSGHERDAIKVLPRMIRHLKDSEDKIKDEDNAIPMAEVWAPLVEDLLKLNNCPDFVVNRGHYFGTEYLNPAPEWGEEPPLSDEEKRALIEYLKTF